MWIGKHKNKPKNMIVEGSAKRVNNTLSEVNNNNNNNNN